MSEPKTWADYMVTPPAKALLEAAMQAQEEMDLDDLERYAEGYQQAKGQQARPVIETPHVWPYRPAAGPHAE